MPQLVPFTDPLTDSRKYRYTAVQRHDGVHEFRQQHRLADARSSEEAGLASPNEGKQQIEDFDARFQNPVGFARFMERNRWGYHTLELVGAQSRTAVERFPEHVEQTTETIR